MPRLATLLLLPLLAGCGWMEKAAPGAAAGPRGPLVVGTDLDPGDRDALVATLRAALPGLTPSLVGPDDGADLLVLRSPAPLEGRDDLVTLPAPLLRGLPKALRGPGDRYVALDRRAIVLAVPRLMANVPTGVLNLTEPRFAGRLAHPPPSNEGLIALLSCALADRGSAVAGRVLEGLVRNDAAPPRSYPPQEALSALLERSVDLALVDHVAARRQTLGDGPQEDAKRRLSQARFVSVYPDATDGVPWTGVVLARPSRPPHPIAADAAVAALLSKSGQASWSRASGAYPVQPGAAEAPGLRPQTSFRWSETSLTERAELRPQVTALLRDSGLGVPRPEEPPDGGEAGPPEGDPGPADDDQVPTEGARAP